MNFNGIKFTINFENKRDKYDFYNFIKTLDIC